ncbi:hypothetical protein F5H01DRAFT_44787 [Linnemannia elongata]|nr:hypothetical protein F5H01DRAFT_44787 [Linnemannia elongata]
MDILPSGHIQCGPKRSILLSLNSHLLSSYSLPICFFTLHLSFFDIDMHIRAPFSTKSIVYLSSLIPRFYLSCLFFFFVNIPLPSFL